MSATSMKAKIETFPDWLRELKARKKPRIKTYVYNKNGVAKEL